MNTKQGLEILYAGVFTFLVTLQQPVIRRWRIRPGVCPALSPAAGIHDGPRGGEGHSGGDRLSSFSASPDAPDAPDAARVPASRWGVWENVGSATNFFCRVRAPAEPSRVRLSGPGGGWGESRERQFYAPTRTFIRRLYNQRLKVLRRPEGDIPRNPVDFRVVLFSDVRERMRIGHFPEYDIHI